MTNLREMTLPSLVMAGPPGIMIELSRRQSMLTASDQLHKLITDYLAWDLAAPGKQHAVEKWKAECRQALDQYNAAKGER